jgi:hypothetical protein
MIRKISLIFIFIVISIYSFTQDKITRIDGQVIRCQITSVDSSRIEFNFKSVDNIIHSSLRLEEIYSFNYQGKIVYVKDISHDLQSIIFDKSFQYRKEVEYADSIEKLNKYFVYTFSDQVISGNNIEYRKTFLEGKSIFEKPYFLIDSKKIDYFNIKFFKNEDGFFASTKNLTESNYFMERVIKGDINLYEKIKEYDNPVIFQTPPEMFPTNNRIFGKPINYYNIGFNDLKRINYKNLKIDLAGNSKSMLFLKKYKNIKNAQTILVVIGGLALIGGTKVFINSPEYSMQSIMISTGVASLCISYFIGINRVKHLKNAIIIYNRL